MNQGAVFILRAVMSFAASFVVTRMYFGDVGWGKIILLAAFMLIVAYAFEALRGKRKSGD